MREKNRCQQVCGLGAMIGLVSMSCAPVAFGYVQALGALVGGALIILSMRWVYRILIRWYTGRGETSPSAAHSTVCALYRLPQPVILLLVSVVVLGFGVIGWQNHKARIHLMDEACGLYQADAFRVMSATIPRSFFPGFGQPPAGCIVESVKGLSAIQAPGFAAFLALSDVSGIPRFRVPWILSVATVLVGALGCCILSGPLAAVCFAVLLFTNPFFDALSRTYLSHTLAAFLLVSGVVCSLIAYSGDERRQAAMSREGILIQVLRLFWRTLPAGIGGLLLLTRPLVGAGFSAYFLALSLCTFISGGRSRQAIVQLFAAFVGPMLGLVLYLIFNRLTTGSFFVTGYEIAFGKEHNPGFSAVTREGIVHTPLRAFVLLTQHTRDLYPFVTSSIVGFCVLLGGVAAARPSKPLTGLIAAVVVVWAFLALFRDTSYFVGPRYYYESMFLLTLVMVLGCDAVARYVAGAAQDFGKAMVIFGVVFCALVSLLWPHTSMLAY